MKRLICIFMSIVIVLGVTSCSKSNISKSYSEKSKVQFIEFIDYITYELKDLDDSAISDVLNEYYALNDNIKMKRLNAILNAINYPDNIFNINIKMIEQYKNMIKQYINDNEVIKLANKNDISLDIYYNEVVETSCELIAYYEIGFNNYCYTVFNDEQKKQLQENFDKYYPQTIKMFNTYLEKYV